MTVKMKMRVVRKINIPSLLFVVLLVKAAHGDFIRRDISLTNSNVISNADRNEDRINFDEKLIPRALQQGEGGFGGMGGFGGGMGGFGGGTFYHLIIIYQI